MATTLGEIIVHPFSLERLLFIKIKKKINHHSTLCLKGILSPQEQEKLLFSTHLSTPIQVEVTGEKPHILFTGIIRKMRVKQEGDLYQIEIKAVSYSFLLDLKRKKRSFQDQKKTYHDLVGQITKEQGASVIDTLSKDKKTEKLIIQYQETDWEFLKRLASHFHGGLVVADTFDSPKYFFGIPQEVSKGELSDFQCIARKNLASYAKASQNANPPLLEIDSLEYELETDAFFSIGNSVLYENVKFFIASVHIESKQGMIKNHYRLKTKKGLQKKMTVNQKIKGVSLSGKVLAVERDQVKVQLSIDQEQTKEKAWLFPYTTNYAAEGSSGWYLMPEIGDTVFIYFPSQREEEGIGLNSIRTKKNSADKISDPNVKYFRTTDGKELKLDEKEILITAKDEEIYIQLNEESGISICSTLPIQVNSQSDLNLQAGEISIQAEENLTLTCKSSTIAMNEEIIIEGKEVRNN